LIAWLAASTPLRAAGHEEGVFGIKGFDRRFLSVLGSPLRSMPAVRQPDEA
jgi:hypothetical protein